jgi:hypothetical protein
MPEVIAAKRYWLSSMQMIEITAQPIERIGPKDLTMADLGRGINMLAEPKQYLRIRPRS